MRVEGFVKHWRGVIALLVLSLGLGLRVPAQTAGHFAADPVYFDYPAGWTVKTDESSQGLAGYVIARAGQEGQVAVYVSRAAMNVPAGSVAAVLTAARNSLVAPRVEQMAQSFEARGGKAERSPARAEIAGQQVDGERLLLSANGQTGTAEVYLLLVKDRLLLVIYSATAKDSASVAAAWDLFRRTVSIGAPVGASGAQPATKESLTTIEQVTNAFRTITDLTKQIVQLREQGNYSAAIPLGERALALGEQTAQLDVPADIKLTLITSPANILGEIYRASGNYERAEKLFQRVLDLTEQQKGAEAAALAIPLNNLASLYYETGRYEQALPLFERAYNIFVKTRGAEQPETATALNNLALVYDANNDFARAEELMQRALAIREKTLGAEHPDVAVTLGNLGGLYDELGDTVRAEAAYRRALAITEKAKGPDHPDLATLLNNLALLCKHKGDIVQAESNFNRALAIEEKALGPNHPALADTLDNLAQIFFDRGDYAHAENLFKRALTIREQALGAEHPDVAESLNNLALLYQTRGDYAQAEPLYERARAIFEQKFGPEHKLVATALDNLAGLYRAENRYDTAQALAERALAIRQKLFGPVSAETAVSYNNLGGIAFARGDYQKAIEMHQRGLQVYEKVFGPQHPQLAAFLDNLSSDYYGAGNTARAIEVEARAAEIAERQIALALSTGSEEQKRLFMATLAEENDYTLSLQALAALNDPRALRLALTTILRRKGRVLDAMSDQIGALRRHLNPADRALLEQLSTTSAELAALVLKGPGQEPPAEYQARLEKLNAEVNDLQAQISARSAEFRVQAQPVTLERVAQALPPGAALVEFALYRPYNVKGQTKAERFGAPHYVAYVLRANQPPAWVELGAAAPIEQTIRAWRVALANPRSTDVRQLARALDEQLMRPVRRLLGDTRQLFISPDEALNLIPFGALVDEQNRYLVETYALTYLTSGRDLLRFSVKAESRQGPVAVADPSFDASATNNAAGASGAPPAHQQSARREHASDTAAEASSAGRRSFDFASARFTRLPGTAEEGRALGRLMPDLTLLTGAQATEAALKQLKGPRILHIATHGFFLPDQEQTRTPGGTRGLALGSAPLPGENPLLRSGLALAGANTRQSVNGEDGVLTALEAAGLDLWGTKLVVLSACETGLGDLQVGGGGRVSDGVYGLRRALVLAGSETQVMSLWQVSDEATRDLMVAYYRRLQAGEGRTEALRQVQLEMIKSKRPETTASAQRGLASEIGQPTGTADRSHPFYWASFIQSGDWRSMNDDMH